jgi:hypothetical protein
MCVRDFKELNQYRIADIVATPALLAEAFCQYATVDEKCELVGHLIRTGELSPHVRDLLLRISSRAGHDLLLARRLAAQVAVETEMQHEEREKQEQEVSRHVVMATGTGL